jgi:hypothetical protein
VGRKAAAALAALRENRGVPAVGGFPGAQAHLGHFAFWNSHKIVFGLIVEI